jgi:hypothetical protein
LKRGSGSGAIVGVVMGCVMACGGSTASSGSPVQKEDFSAQATAAVCDVLAGCCSTASLPYDGAACRTGFAAQLAPQLSNPKVAYDPTAGGSCVAAIRGLGCAPLDGARGPCSTVFAGTVPSGEPCSSSAECATPAGGHASCMGGQCHVEPRGKSGDTCSATCTESGSSTSCSFSGVAAQSGAADGGVGPVSTTPGPARCYTNDGLTCGPSGTCEKIPALSEACTFGGCAADAFCDQGRCAALRDVGGTCNSFDECVTTAFCDTTARTCAAKKTNGASCDTELECQSGSCQAGKCAGRVLATATSCQGVFK